MADRSPEDFLTYGSRVRGCVLGGAIGDALGAPIEFSSLGGIRDRYGPAGITGLVPDGSGRIGLITDDTQMTLFTMEGLLRADVRFVQRGVCHVPSVIRSAYLRWLDTQQYDAPPARDDRHVFRTGGLREQRWLYARRAPGNACLSGLHAQGGQATGEAGRAPQLGEPGPVNPGSKGCGTVMRSAPFGLVGGSPREAFETAAECAQITHGHPTGYLAAGALAVLIHSLVQGVSIRGAVADAMEILGDYPAHEETTEALRAAVALADDGDPTPEKVETLGGAWVAEEALAIAVYCALVDHPGASVDHPGPESSRRALLLAVNHSGDSDSTGAICGNIIGARYGDLALPGEWLVELEGRAPITGLADDFAVQMTQGRAACRSEGRLAGYPGD
ncbi:ADP-ribosylglycohydrolase family protein [Sphaerimonospora thailandensis]|uniref:ADP-ribosylglycohydrolase n=1 Tax=Sphaerimonospora thailandensis TaxID=795644 RepID=A0A8J3VXW5_9ACTN|nr:ADP-ribosylglycohydrolase family protein [Sphaerimonospora thailandensis]GIH68912.1 ADP-ribosylglycohydrolase [Sphaerimonospora thailandensis]